MTEKSDDEIKQEFADLVNQIKKEDLEDYVKELKKSLPKSARWSMIAGNVIAGILALLAALVGLLVLIGILRLLYMAAVWILP